MCCGRQSGEAQTKDVLISERYKLLDVPGICKSLNSVAFVLSEKLGHAPQAGWRPSWMVLNRPASEDWTTGTFNRNEPKPADMFQSRDITTYFQARAQSDLSAIPMHSKWLLYG